MLFLERFVQLARPGGKVAIILPEGVLANSNLLYVREWLVQNFTIRAVVGLPRETFKGTGTTAKTGIPYLEKRKPTEGHQVLLAEVGEVDLDEGLNPELETVVTALREQEGTLAELAYLGLSEKSRAPAACAATVVDDSPAADCRPP